MICKCGNATVWSTMQVGDEIVKVYVCPRCRSLTLVPDIERQVEYVLEKLPEWVDG